jgi:hypothetical protein
VKSRFQSLPFKRNLQRYNVVTSGTDYEAHDKASHQGGAVQVEFS